MLTLAGPCVQLIVRNCFCVSVSGASGASAASASGSGAAGFAALPLAPECFAAAGPAAKRQTTKKLLQMDDRNGRLPVVRTARDIITREGPRAGEIRDPLQEAARVARVRAGSLVITPST